MGFFDKPVVDCCVCEQQIGVKEKRWRTKDDLFLCSDCQKPFGIINGTRAFTNYTADEMRELVPNRIESNAFWLENRKAVESFEISRNIENILCIDDAAQKWFAVIPKEITIFMDENEKYAIVFDFSDIDEVFVTQGDRVVTSITSTKREKGITKSVVGGLFAGPAGAVIGGMLAKERSESHAIETQKFYVNVGLDGVDAPLVIAVDSEQLAIMLQRAFSSMMPSPVESNQEAPAENSLSPADELRKYKALLDDDIITQEEFETKKKLLLGL